MPDHYPFQVTHSKTSADCRYTFITQHNLEYLVYFIGVTKIIDILDEYPVLSNGMFMGIELLNDDSSLPAFDPNTGLTVSVIVKDYIEQYGNNSIILYNCDEKDGRQEKRHLAFTRWFDLYAGGTGFISYHKIIAEEENNETFTFHFIALLYSATHKRIELINKEIQRLETWLTAKNE